MDFLAWDPHWTKMTISMLLSVACGGAIGLERSWRGRQAGFRTYAIVCLAACALVGAISQESGSFSLGDPASRVIQGLLTGVGFLGAGVIVKDGLTIKGLTTAASIWLTSAIGVLAGFGMSALTVLTTCLALAILSAFKYIEGFIGGDRYIQIVLHSQPENSLTEEYARQMLSEFGIKVVEIAFSKKNSGAILTLSAVYYDTDAPNRLAKHLMNPNSPVENFDISATPDA